MNDDEIYGGKPRFSKKCKEFKKKNAIAVYILIPDSVSGEMKHREMLRVVNPKEGEYYLIPRPLDKNDFHISYHKSGAFHWKIDRKLVIPQESEGDFARAFFDYIGMQSAWGWVTGYCVACGKKVTRNNLKKMLEIASYYVPIPALNTDAACDDIYNRRHVSLPNHSIKTMSDIKMSPMASGVMIAELKDSIGILQALNITICEDNQLLLHKRISDSHSEKMNEMVVPQTSVHEAHYILM